jgi:hypothetical protein
MGGGAETDEHIKSMGPEILESSVPGPDGQNGGAPCLDDTCVQGSSRRAESALEPDIYDTPPNQEARRAAQNTWLDRPKSPCLR